MQALNVNLDALTADERGRIESLALAFDLAWTKDALAARVQGLPADRRWRAAALIELVRIDLERRWRIGERPSVEEYLARFPEMGTPSTAALELVVGEIEARRHAGAAIDEADLAARFPRHASRIRGLASAHPEPAMADTAAAVAAGHSTFHSLATLSGAAPAPDRFGRYLLLRPLGQGGMGAVFLAEDTALHRQVALKIPRFDANADPEIRARFLREARAAAHLEHPNLCPIHDVGEVDGMPYLTMAYIDGKSLADVRRDQAPNERQAILLVIKLARALAEAHKRGLVHRDLKPTNVMINRRDEPIVLDFGLALTTNAGDARLTREGSVLGTPAYMPLEQMRGDLSAIGPRSDIYSLGVILYELLTGKLPFEGPANLVLVKRASEAPTPLSKHRPDIDPQLETICHKAMATQPAERYADMTEFAAALSRHLKQTRIANAKESAEPRARRRGPAWLALAAGLLAAAGLAGTVIYLATDRGTVRIAVNDPAAVVRIDGQVIHINNIGQPIVLRAGAHELQVERADVVTEARQFTVRRGVEEVLRIEWAALPNLAKPARDGQPENAPAALDLAKAQAAPPVAGLLFAGGIKARIRLPNMPLGENQRGTFEAYVTVTVKPKHRGVIIGNTEDGGIELSVTQDGRPSLLAATKAGIDGAISSTSIADRRVHLAGVFNSRQFMLFVDGKKVADRGIRGEFKPSKHHLVIGASPEKGGGADFFCHGTIEQVRVSRGTRYTADFAPEKTLGADANTIALYRFERETGRIAFDYSGHQRHGVIIGAQWLPVLGAP